MRIPNKTLAIAAAAFAVNWTVGCAESPNVGNLGFGGDGGSDVPGAGTPGMPDSGSGGAVAGSPAGGSGASTSSAGSTVMPQGGSAGSVATAAGTGGVAAVGGGSSAAGGTDDVSGGTGSENMAGETSSGGTGSGGAPNAGSTGKGGTGGTIGTAGKGGAGVGGAGQGGVAGKASSGGGGSTAQAGTSSSGGAPPQGSNLFQGSGFEGETLEGWVRRGLASIALTTDEAHSGLQSVAVTGRSQNWHGIEYNVLPLVAPGGTYRVVAWGKLAAGSGAAPLTLTREMVCQGAAATYTWIKNVPAASDSAWVELNGTFTVPVDCVPTTVLVYVESTTVTLSYYIDDVGFFDITPP